MLLTIFARGMVREFSEVTMQKLFVFFILVLGTVSHRVHAEEPISSSESFSPHIPYVFYDVGRHQAGVGYRYKYDIFMYDIGVSYTYVRAGYYAPYSMVSLSPTIHSIAFESSSCITYIGWGVKLDLFFDRVSPRMKDRFALSPVSTVGHLFKKGGCPSPFVEIYYIPFTIWYDVTAKMHQIGLKMGMSY